MFGPADNRISPADRSRVYEILGFIGPERAGAVPSALQVPVLGATARLLELHAKAREEHHRGSWGGSLRGLTEFRVGVELAGDRSTLGFTDVKRGRPNHAGRELDRTRTIVGTIHTHPWDVAQSIGDVRNLIRGNDVLGGVVTYAGKISLLVKPPDLPEADRSPFASEVTLQAASLSEARTIVRTLGLIGAMSAAFDLPDGATRDPYIRAVCDRLGLLCYTGHVQGPTLQRA
jgi:hypothetical protein